MLGRDFLRAVAAATLVVGCNGEIGGVVPRTGDPEGVPSTGLPDYPAGELVPMVSVRDGGRRFEGPEAALKTLEFEAWVRPEVDGIDAALMLSSGNVSDFSDAPVEVRFADDGLVKVRDGAVYRDTGYRYARDQWYRIAIAADVLRRTYDVSAQQEGSAEVRSLVVGASFSSAVDALQGLTHWAAWSSQDAALELAEISWTAAGSCAPMTCLSLGAACGGMPDGCGGELVCGSCSAGDTCEDGLCVCVPTTCESLGVTCGAVLDGCGGTLSCGACAEGQLCSDGVCVEAPASPPPACVPLSCEVRGRECGFAADGCNGVVSCGTCPSGETCGAGSCVCEPRSCLSLGVECGPAADGCGGALSCGGCPSGETCQSGRCVDEANCPSATPSLSASSGWQSRQASSANDTLYFEALARPGSSALDGVVAIGSETLDSFSDAAIAVRFASDGLIDVRNGSIYDRDAFVEYAAGAWYEIAISANVEARTYDVEVGPCGGARVRVITGAAFRTGSSNGPLLHWGAWSSQQSALELATPTWMGTGVCVPATCSSLGYECGQVANGCGQILQCGTCFQGETCSAGTCIDTAPPPVAPPPSGPPAGGFPSASNTGITDYWCPRWASLRTTMSSVTLGTGELLEYANVNGSVRFSGRDQVARCVRANSSDGSYAFSCSASTCTEGALMEDIHANLTNINGDYDAAVLAYTDEVAIRRGRLMLGCDGLKQDGGLFQDSFIEDKKRRCSVGNSTWPDGWVCGSTESDYCNRADPHSDAHQIAGANIGPLWFVGNRIESPWQYVNAGHQISDGPQHDITWIGNMYQGGGIASAVNADKGGWGDFIMQDNEVVRDSWLQRGFGSSWEGSAFFFRGDGSPLNGCVEAKDSGGSWTNRFTAVDAAGNPDGALLTDADPGNMYSGAVRDGQCGRENGWPASSRPGGNWNNVTPVPYWDVSGVSLPERSSCSRGQSACNDIDITANASGVTPRGSVSGYDPRWRYSCGGSPNNIMNDGSQSSPPCSRGHCRGGYQDGGADLWYDYPSCDGSFSCTFQDVCDFSAEGPGTYTIKVYSESGPGTGVRVSDHAERTFTVN